MRSIVTALLVVNIVGVMVTVASFFVIFSFFFGLLHDDPFAYGHRLRE